MEKILFYYNNNKNDLLNYNTEKLDEFFKLISEINFSYDCKSWFNECNNLLVEFYNNFNIYDSGYNFKICNMLEKFKKSVPSYININLLNLKEKDVYRKIKLNIQLLEYLQTLNYNQKVFFDKEKYDIIISTYKIFYDFGDHIIESIVEWYSNQFIFFYSKSDHYINICIYELDDLHGFKLFLTVRNNLDKKKITIYAYDIIINDSSDFYEKLETIQKWNFINYPDKTKYIYLIDINKIANYFDILEKNNIKYCESSYVDEKKMFSFIKDFLNN